MKRLRHFLALSFTFIRENRFMLAVIAAFYLIVASFSYLIYQQTYESLFNGLQNELTSTARLAGASINGDEHRQLQESGAESSPLYHNLKKRLQEVRDANPKIRYAYTMAHTNDPNKLQFIVDAEEDPKLVSHLGDPYDVSGIIPQGFDGALADSEPYTDEWGTFLSGYAPIYDSSGRAVAIIGIDMSLETVNKTLAGQQKLIFIPLGILFLVPLVLSRLLFKKTRIITQAQPA
ncbi:MAG TPA: PDC sensor domain-containing protein [Candidatus Aquicultor sp.]